MSDHEQWEELAAAHALGSLEPEDEQRFEAHLLTCRECAAVQADTEAVMAELATTADQVAPPPELKARLMAAIHEESDDQPRMAVISSPDQLDSHRQRKGGRLADTWVRLAAAACVVLLAVVAGGLWTLNRPANQEPRFVALHGDTQNTATVELIGDKAWVIPTALPANDAATSRYVLWAVPSEGDPVAVGGFDVQAGSAAVLPIGRVSPSPASIKAFAVSKEPGRTVPAKPSTVVAQGNVTWPVVDAFRTMSLSRLGP